MITFFKLLDILVLYFTLVCFCDLRQFIRMIHCKIWFLDISCLFQHVKGALATISDSPTYRRSDNIFVDLFLALSFYISNHTFNPWKVLKENRPEMLFGALLYSLAQTMNWKLSHLSPHKALMWTFKRFWLLDTSLHWVIGAGHSTK